MELQVQYQSEFLQEARQHTQTHRKCNKRDCLCSVGRGGETHTPFWSTLSRGEVRIKGQLQRKERTGGTVFSKDKNNCSSNRQGWNGTSLPTPHPLYLLCMLSINRTQQSHASLKHPKEGSFLIAVNHKLAVSFFVSLHITYVIYP